MTLNAIDLCARALIRLGARPITSFDDGTVEAEVARNLYPQIRDGLLSSHPWSFATQQVRLPRLVAEPVADFAHAYQLPADFLRALSAGSGTRGRGMRYRIAETRLHSDADEVVLTYIYRPVEAVFPAFFAQAVIARLAAEFCLPITESISRAEALYKFAEDEMRRAKLVDAQQDTPETFEDFTLVEVRQ